MIKLGDLKIDPVSLGSQGNAVLGIRASGKSYLGTLLGERLMDAGIPIIAFDPIGVWRYLKVPGPKGVGYPVVVAGGEHGDLPLTPDGAPEIVRAAMQAGVSLVLDLYSMKLSKADWRRIVERCVRVLLYENKAHGLRHVFIEEAAEFAPQIVGRDYGTVYAEIEKLARMGGNALLGYTLISQRAEQVNKAVLELCDNLFLFRQKGRRSLESLSKWLDIGSAKGSNAIIASLPTLPQGVCWAWPAGHDTPVQIDVPTKRSFHPDRSKMHGDLVEEIVNRSAVDVSSFVETMKSGLEKITAEAQANDPKRLKARIADLEREKAKAPPTEQIIVNASAEQIEKARREGFAQGRSEGYDQGNAQGQAIGYSHAAEQMTAIAIELNAIAETRREQTAGFTKRIAEINKSTETIISGNIPTPAPAPRQSVVKVAPAPVQREAKVSTVPPSGEPIGAEKKPLAILARVYPGGYTEAQWAIMAGFKRSGGTWGTYKSRLRAAGRIEERANLWYATEKGCADVGAGGEPMPEPGSALVAWWSERIGAERKILEFLAAAYPWDISHQGIADALDMTANGGTFGTYLSRLRSNGLIEEPEKGSYRVSPNLMGAA